MTSTRIITFIAASLTIASPLHANKIQKVSEITVQEGFKVEKLYQVAQGQGSWVAMTWDDQGRLITSDQYGGLFRVTLEPFKVEPLKVKLGAAQKAKIAAEETRIAAQKEIKKNQEARIAAQKARIAVQQERIAAKKDVQEANKEIEDAYGEIKDAQKKITEAQRKTQKIPKVAIGGAQGLLWHQGALYVSVATNHITAPGIYRLTDSNGDDELDKIELLAKLNTGGEHGPHSLVASPDGKWIYMVSGNFTHLPKEVDRFSATKNWSEDHLLKRMADGKGHAGGLKAPGGWIIRFSPDAKTWELVSSGYRNVYDMAFNEHGELIAYDADMEYDFGTPWYRPTRMCHAISGSEFGWRNGTGKWPEYYLDSMPSAVDIGPGSPTGVVAGLGAKFPAKYQRAVFALDWTFATMYAVHLQPTGATYTGTREPFLSSTGLPLTDAVIGADGAMYFMIGGRRAGSGLYRVTYEGAESTAPISPSPLPKDFALRRKLEAMHLGEDRDLDLILSSLSHSDRVIRSTARVALEHLPVQQWIGKMRVEKNQRPLCQMAVAVARQGDKEQAHAALKQLAQLDFAKLDTDAQLELLRAQALLMSRHGKSEAQLTAQITTQLEPHFPSKNEHVNRELCRMLSYLQVPSVIGKTLALIAEPKEVTPPNWIALAGKNERYGSDIINMLKNMPSTQSLHYVYCLKGVTAPWTEKQRKQYFTWFSDAIKKDGGKSYKYFIKNIYKEALKNVTRAERKMISSWELDVTISDPFKNLPMPKGPGKNWTVEEVVALDLKKANLANGEKMFRASYCAACHEVKGKGGGSGPDMTFSGGRFGPKEFAEAIIKPGDVISNQYSFKVIKKKDGSTVVGKILGENDGFYVVAYDAFNFEKTIEVDEADVESITESPVSPMPPGMISRLNEQEATDLMGYLMSLK